MLRTIVLLAATLFLLGCESPEVKRARGGGPGADLGYRGDPVEMHAGSEPYHGTPQLIDARFAGIDNKDQRQASRE